MSIKIFIEDSQLNKTFKQELKIILVSQGIKNYTLISSKDIIDECNKKSINSLDDHLRYLINYLIHSDILITNLNVYPHTIQFVLETVAKWIGIEIYHKNNFFAIDKMVDAIKRYKNSVKNLNILDSKDNE